jgi:hypothetical protein
LEQLCGQLIEIVVTRAIIMGTESIECANVANLVRRRLDVPLDEIGHVGSAT